MLAYIAYTYVPITQASFLSFWLAMVGTSAAANTVGGILLILACSIAIFKIIVGYFL